MDEQRQSSNFMALKPLATRMEELREEAVNDRQAVEQRMVWDELQYQGIYYDMERSKRDYFETRRGQKVPPQINITKPLTDMVASRLGDMLFPTNEKNWALGPSKVSESQPGASGLNTQQDAAKQADAEKRAKRMENVIDDQLSECHYPKQGRAAIFDGCKLGLGLLKGPITTGRTRKTFVQEGGGIYVPQVEIISEPSIVRVDPWNWFPIRATSIETCEGCFEVHPMNQVRMREGIQKWGFDPDAVREILRNEPTSSAVHRSMRLRAHMLGHRDVDVKSYMVWEYRGPLGREEMESVAEVYGIEFDDDPLDIYMVELWFCEGVVLKAKMSLLEGDYRLPYYTWSLNKEEGDVFGYGVPYEIRDEQWVASAFWEMMVYDSKLSSGPQIVRMKGVVEPEDDDYRLNGPKVWSVAADSEVEDVENAFRVFEIPSNLEKMLPIFELAQGLAEKRINMPMWSQGEPSQATNQTSSGTAMLLNMVNIVPKDAAKDWDDDITIPMIEGMHHYNMLHHQDPEIKGDYDCIPKAAAYLLVKDIQAQHVQALTLLSENPRFAPRFNDDRLLELNLEVLDIAPGEILLDEEQYQQKMEEMAQQPDYQALEAELKTAQIKLEEYKLVMEDADRKRDDDFRIRDRDMTHTEKMRDADVRDRSAEATVTREIIRQETEFGKEAMKRETTIQQVREQLGVKNREIESKERIKGAEMQRAAREMDLKERLGSGI